MVAREARLRQDFPGFGGVIHPVYRRSATGISAWILLRQAVGG